MSFNDIQESVNVELRSCYKNHKRSRTLIDEYCIHRIDTKLHCKECEFYNSSFCNLASFWNNRTDEEMLDYITQAIPNIFEILKIDGINGLDEIIKAKEFMMKYNLKERE